MNKHIIWLYHATFRVRLASIKQNGLGAKQIKNWEFSEFGVTCLTDNPEVAFSFCETADDVADSVYDSGIVVLAIPMNILDRKKLSYDKNVRLDRSDTTNCRYYTYKGIIQSNTIFVYTRNNGVVGRLNQLKRVKSYE